MRADEGRGLINLVVMAIILAVTMLGPLLERWRRRRAQEKGEAPPPGPEPEEPKLPYEDMVDQVFGPYMERRRKAFEARKSASRTAVETEEEAEEEEEVAEYIPPARRFTERGEPRPPAPPAPEPAIRIIEEEPAPLPPIEKLADPAAPRRRSLDDVLFANPRWGAAAKLVVASEILSRPKALRR